MLAHLLELFGKPEWSLIEAHQVSTHLSIGLLVGALFFDIGALFVSRKRESWREAALWMQLLGTLLLALTFALGFYGNPFAGKKSEIAQKAYWHYRFGLVTLIFSLLLAAWRAARWARWRRAESTLYATVTLVGMALITVTGWMGGHVLD
jgi:uncharacterized membrane protein